MRKTALPPVLVKYFVAIAAAFLLAGLSLLVGCQGMAPTASNQPVQTVSPTLSITPATLDLGSVAVGKSKTASGTLSASGARVTVTAASTSDSGVFTVGGLSLPVTIPNGQSVPFTITFSPKVSGTANASLSFTSTAQAPTTTVKLSGTGMAAGTHIVTLSWDPSTSPHISGYNVYRSAYASACGSFAKINHTLDTSTIYADTGVVGGKSYCYATTAVNTSAEESAYSNIVANVRIPTS
jgi:hypothetical protein